MEPLSKEEIQGIELTVENLFDGNPPMIWQRLFYSAKLGAAYEQAMKNQKEQQP